MTDKAEGLEKRIELERMFGTEIMLGKAGAGKRPAATMSLEQIRDGLGECTRCRLHEERIHIVFGEGSATARLLFVGEGPGANEDRQGRPFVGRAGTMLTDIIEKVFFLRREDVYIANIVKCRPPSNRNPLPDECATCIPFLLQQIESIGPEIIVALGGTATHNLLDTKLPISRLRGAFHDFGSVRIMPTYHPAYLLRNPAQKRKVYEDMLMVREALGMRPPGE